MGYVRVVSLGRVSRLTVEPIAAWTWWLKELTAKDAKDAKAVARLKAPSTELDFMELSLGRQLLERKRRPRRSRSSVSLGVLGVLGGEHLSAISGHARVPMPDGLGLRLVVEGLAGRETRREYRRAVAGSKAPCAKILRQG